MRDSIPIFLSQRERKIKVSIPSSRGRATVHRTVAFNWFESRISETAAFCTIRLYYDPKCPSVCTRTGCIRKVMDSPTGNRPFGRLPKLGRMRDSICIFALWGKNKGVAGPLPGQQHAPGVLHLDGFESRIRWQKEKPHPKGVVFFLAEDEGFEPPQTESESGVLPLHKSSKRDYVIIRT